MSCSRRLLLLLVLFAGSITAGCAEMVQSDRGLAEAGESAAKLSAGGDEVAVPAAATAEQPPAAIERVVGNRSLTIQGCTYTDVGDGELGNLCTATIPCGDGYGCRAGFCVPRGDCS